jgi:hypothetical protein
VDDEFGLFQVFLHKPDLFFRILKVKLNAE